MTPALDKRENIDMIKNFPERRPKVFTELQCKGFAAKPLYTLFMVWIALALLLLPGELSHPDPKGVPKTVPSQVARFKIPGNPLSSSRPHVEGVSPEERFRGLIMSASRRHSVDPALVKALIMVESGYDPKAVSTKGAVGLMQLMPGISESLGVKDPFDPVHNVHGGVKHLSDLLEFFDGSVYLALAAYHAGIDRVNQRPRLPRSTQRFVKRVFEYYHHYKADMEEGEYRA
jgi:soluble lytic murein transglycosylase-like protein